MTATCVLGDCHSRQHMAATCTTQAGHSQASRYVGSSIYIKCTEKEIRYSFSHLGIFPIFCLLIIFCSDQAKQRALWSCLLILKKKGGEGRREESPGLGAEPGTGSMTGQGTRPKDPGPSIRNLKNTRLRREDDCQAVTRTIKLKGGDTDLSAQTGM